MNVTIFHSSNSPITFKADASDFMHHHKYKLFFSLCLMIFSLNLKESPVCQLREPQHDKGHPTATIEKTVRGQRVERDRGQKNT